MTESTMSSAAVRALLGAVAVFCAADFWATEASALQFTDVTNSAGVSYQQGPPLDPLVGAELTSMTGGAAAGDYDGDGHVDLFVTRIDNHDLLFRNKGDGTFEDVTTTAFGASPLVRKTNGAAWADIDNDGDLDLYTTAVQEERHLLYLNNGGTFTEVAAARGAGVGGAGLTVHGTGVAFGDYDRDGYLDAFVAEWRPTSFDSPIRAALLRNDGAAQPGHFQNTTAAEGALVEGPSTAPFTPSFSFSPRFTDLDGDRNPDLAIASDFNTSKLFWNQGDGAATRFLDGTVVAGVFTGQNDMGSTVGDVNGDGLLDWFITDIHFDDAASAHPNGNRLFLNQGDRTFQDATDAAGVRDGDWGWGTALADFDLDGDLDLTMTNGFVDGDQFLNDPMRLWSNDGTGVFTEVSAAAGITENRQGRGLLTFDYDNDGDLDIFVANNGGAPALLRNDTITTDGFLKIKAVGVESNRDGVGARVIVTPDLANPDAVLIREIDAGSHYLAQSESIAHFGVGDHATIDEIMILWPSGTNQRLTDVPANSTLTVTENSADFNGDGVVDAADYTLWRDTYGATGDLLIGDADADGEVDPDDLAMWQAAFGAVTYSISTAGPVSIPEPASLGLFAGLMGGFFASRRAKPRA